MGVGKRKFWIIGIVLLVVVLAIIVALPLLVKPKTSLNTLELDAQQMNTGLPIMLDADTRLDKTAFVPDSTFQYNYTLVNMLKDSVDIASLYARAMQPVTDDARNNPKLQFYRDNKITLAFSYSDKNGAFLFKIMVTPDKYR